MQTQTQLRADAFAPAPFDPEVMVAELAPSLAALEGAMAFGRDVAARVDRVYFIACGSPNRAMRGIQYWIEHYSRNLEVRRYFPAEFVAQAPRRLDSRTLVILGSKSGTTPETVAAAEFLRDKPCITAGVTQSDSAPLARAVQHRFLIGETPESFLGMAMIVQSLVGGLLAARDGWPHAEALHASLMALPRVIADTGVAHVDRGARDALALRGDKTIYLLASGPCFTNAYVFGVCILMEMLWLHAYPVDAAEFFHGPFEILQPDTPLVLILGEDPSRPLMERVVRFSEKHSRRLFIYDSRAMKMPGIAPEVRPMLAPYALQTALKRVSANLSVLHDKPLGTRRYMWKGEY
jgi:fructoselysine 6-phosphate deglycase